MKNLTNILSYLWLLLLMAVTACSDMEGEVDAMEVEEEVELTIRAELSEMATSTRAVPTENIHSITALAFDVDSKLIKVVAATLINQQATSGTLKVKVPLRTRSIHFLANDAAGITANDLGKTPNELLKKDVGSLYYWGMASFQGNNAAEAAAALKAYAGPLTLYRNQAKVTLVGGNGDYIVGFLNYNTRGRLVPYDVNGTIGYQASVHTSAETSSLQSHTKDNNISGQQYTEYFLFEHDNEKNNEKNSALYAICYIGGKYYKVAFASSQTYFDIVRNHNYRIVTTGIDTMYGEDSFDAAKDSEYPINDKVIDEEEGMTATAEPALISNTAGTTTQVTVTIPEGLTELKINAGTAFTVTSNESLAVNANGSYNITGRTEATFTLTLKDEAAGTTGEQTINCTARAKYKEATCSTTVTLQQPIVAVPVAYSLDYTTGENSVSDLLVYVTIQKDVTTLTFASDYFDAMVVGQTLALTDDAYAITHDENAESTTIPVRLRLKQDKKTDTNASFTFGSKDANVESAVIDKIDLNPVSGENVRWQGNVPLNSADYATIVPLKWEWFRTGDSFIPAGSKLNLEFTVTGDNTFWLEVFEICGDTENDWNNPVHQFAELDNSNRYTADGNGNGNRTLSLTLSAYTFTTIFENFRSNFLGETDIAMAIRGAGITLTKVSVVEQAALPVYELWFENNNTWNGSQDYATFFTRMGDLTTTNGNQGNMNATFYDPSFTVNEVTYSGADAKRTNAMVMGENNSISFTISDTRYLTLLVASNGNAPSIDLLKNGLAWTATSNDAKVPANYNFANGDITNKGRLIRYELSAGTYTLQRGNDDNDYLLYYMRVTKDKPTMTDIVQPTVSDYALSWSGNNGGYLKDPNNDAKYFVDEEATNFIPTLTYNGLSEVSLSTVKLDVTTDVWTFNNSDDSSQGSMQQNTINYTEANISSLAYNEGAYTLSGSVTGISGTSYKYATFYDNLQLKSVSFNVKNTVKVALYNSWDSDAQPVTEFVEGGENILGFKMPQHTLPVNPLNSEKINFTIENSWQLKQSGAGIYQVEGLNYQIGDQANQNQQEGQTIHYHPRKEWTYKISWNNIPSKTITPTSTTDDVYFSYNGIVSKNPTITTTQGAETPLSITLDFYQTEGENLGDGATYDLKAGSTPFYLKATIYSDDAVKYSGRTVLLNGTFSSSKGYGKDKNGIHWDYSEIDTPKDGYGKIACNSDGTQLQFTIDPNETDYLIEWVFVPGGQYSGDDINFTYQISGATVDSNACTLNNESQTTLNVDVLDIALDFDYPATFDGSPAPLDNMVFGVSNFYLRATISQADATAFAGSQVLLAGAFSGGGNYAVSWYDSRVNEGTINYDDSYNGTGLLFTIDANQQNYFIHWCFERYNYGEDPASFTYTISKPEDANYRFFRVSGETETSLTLKNSAEIFSGRYLFNTGNVWDKFYSISETFPVGTKITVDFGESQRDDGGCTVKFCDAASQNALKIPSFTGVNYGPDNNLYFSFTGSRIFDVYVNETTELYINGDGSGNGNSGTPNGNLSNKPLEGFKIEGTDAILQSITVTAPESALRNAQDNNNE